MADRATKLTRAELLSQLTATLLGLRAQGPTLVAIDGRSAAGKTTFADDLAQSVRTHGRPTLRISIDDFHPPGYKYRSRDGLYTPRSYYTEGYDLAAFRAYALDPLREGARRCRLTYWDSFNDAAFPEAWAEIPDRVVVIIDGIFLLRPDFRHYWDYAIWLQVDWDTMIERATERDIAWVSSAEVVVNHYRSCWIPRHTFYETQDHPAQAANLIVDNRNPEMPALVSGITPTQQNNLIEKEER